MSKATLERAIVASRENQRGKGDKQQSQSTNMG